MKNRFAVSYAYDNLKESNKGKKGLNLWVEYNLFRKNDVIIVSDVESMTMVGANPAHLIKLMKGYNG